MTRTIREEGTVYDQPRRSSQPILRFTRKPDLHGAISLVSSQLRRSIKQPQTRITSYIFFIVLIILRHERRCSWEFARKIATCESAEVRPPPSLCDCSCRLKSISRRKKSSISAHLLFVIGLTGNHEGNNTTSAITMYFT